MSLVSIALESTKNSKFYLNHKQISEELIKFNDKNKFYLNGEYDSYFIKFDLSGIYDKAKLKINGARKLTNISTGVIPADSVYQEKTNFSIETSFKNNNDLIIERKTVLRKIKTILKNRKSLSLNDQYFAHSKNVGLIEKIKTLKSEWLTLTEYKLDRLEFKGATHIEVSFFYFFKSKEEWNKIFRTISTIKNSVS